MAPEQRTKLRRRLALAGCLCFFLVSATETQLWFNPDWRAFDLAFMEMAKERLDQPTEPQWLYALAFPYVALNFACLVRMAMGRGETLFWPYLVTGLLIAVTPVFGLQGMTFRPVFSDIVTMVGYGIWGALLMLLWLDRNDKFARDTAKQ